MVVAFKREKISGAWRKLRSEELHILFYATPDIIKVMK
jgi:hypothetical protein